MLRLQLAAEAVLAALDPLDAVRAHASPVVLGVQAWECSRGSHVSGVLVAQAEYRVLQLLVSNVAGSDPS